MTKGEQIVREFHAHYGGGCDALARVIDEVIAAEREAISASICSLVGSRLPAEHAGPVCYAIKNTIRARSNAEKPKGGDAT